jgi:hypothetical protein
MNAQNRQVLSLQPLPLVLALLVALLLAPLLPYPLSNVNITSPTFRTAFLAYKSYLSKAGILHQVNGLTDSWDLRVQPLLLASFATMRSFVVTTALALYASVVAAQQSSGATSYLAKEVPIARTNLIANIGPDGSKSQGAKVRASSLLNLISTR